MFQPSGFYFRGGLNPTPATLNRIVNWGTLEIEDKPSHAVIDLKPHANPKSETPGSVMCHFSAPVGTSSLCCGCRC